MKKVTRLLATIIVVLMTVNCLSTSLMAKNGIKEKQKKLPLADLQNPDSPSFVPIPYPKTRKDVIIDFKYFIKLNIVSRQRMGKQGVNPNDFTTYMADLLNKKSRLKIGKISKAHNLSRSAADFYYVFEIRDQKGHPVAKIAMYDSGLYASANYNGGKPLRGLGTLEEGLEVFKKKKDKLGLEHTKKELDNASAGYEVYVGALAKCTAPIRKIKVGNANYYLDFQDRLYKINKAEPLELDNLKKWKKESDSTKTKYPLCDYLNKKLITIEKMD